MKPSISLLLLFFFNLSFGQPIDIDYTFNPLDEGDGNATIQTGALIKQTLTLPSGKIIVVGSFSRYRHWDSVRSGITCLNADGSVDTTFTTGSGTAGPTGSVVHKVLRQPDGKLIIGGAFATFNGLSRSRIARLHEDGSLDTSFDPGSGFNNNAVVYTMHLLPSGKIIVGGSFYEYNGAPAHRLICLNPDGSRDAGFTASIPSGMVLDIRAQPDGKLLIAGNFTSYSGTAVGNMARIDATGSLDATFLTSLSGANNMVSTVAVQPDGKILAGGDFTQFNSVSKNRLVRLHSDGAIDISFSSANNFNNKVNCLTLLSDGHIAVGGAFSYLLPSSEPVNRFIILDGNGVKDPEFVLSRGFSSQVWHINEWPGNLLLISGSFTEYQYYRRVSIAMLSRNGHIAENFQTGGNGANFTVSTISGGNGGAVYFGGGFSYYNNEYKGNFVKTTASGIIDTTMDTRTGFSGGDVYKIKELSDGKVLVAGNFSQYNGFTQRGIIRLQPDGAIDSVFAGNCNMGTGAVLDFAVQADDKIILCGAFTTVNGMPRQRIARLHPDGTLDETFVPPTELITSIRRLVLIGNGKVLVAGGFSNWGGTGIDNLARLNADGSIDPTFNSGTGSNDIRDMLIQPDGKILIAGGFTQVNGTPMNRIARLHNNGVLDTDFQIGAGADWIINAIQLQNDGSVVIGGGFTHVDGLPYSKLARLNMDGSVDASFDIGTGFEVGFNANEVYALQLADTTHLIVAGRFGSYNGIKKNAIVKLSIGESIPLRVNILTFTATKKEERLAMLNWEVAQNSQTEYFEIQCGNDGINFREAGRIYANGESGTDPKNYSFADTIDEHGKFFYRIKQHGRDGTFAYSSVNVLYFLTETAPSITLYPNPASALLHVNIPDNHDTNGTVSIYDIQGSIKLFRKIELPRETSEFTIFIGALPVGSYYISYVSGTGGIHTTKFIKI